MSRWDDLLQKAAARALEPPSPPESRPASPVQAPAPGTPLPAPAGDEDLAAWLATAALPAGPLDLAVDRHGAPWLTLTDPEQWRRSRLAELAPNGVPAPRSLAPSPEALARRQRCLDLSVARVRAVVGLGRPLTVAEDAELRARMHRPRGPLR